MPGAHKSVDELKQAVTLRDGGYSLTAISRKTGISPATLSRHFKRLGASKGGLNAEAIEQARQELLNDAGFIFDIKSQIAAVIVDDLAHVSQLREAMTLTLEGLMADSSLPAHYKTRGLAALATSLRLTQEAARKALAVDDQPIEQESIPVLTITELTSSEIEAMLEQQREEVGYPMPIVDESNIDDIGDIVEEGG